MKDVLDAALRAVESGEPAALVTVVATEGSTPQKAGAKMVVYPDGRIVGTIGGGCIEAEMTWRARQVIETRKSQLASYELTPDQAGEDGLVAQPLARMARAAGFRVEVVDDRVKFANRERFPEADVVMVEDFAAAASKLTLGRNTYAVVVTRGHRSDADALQACLGRGLRFVGLLASRPKVVHVFSDLEARGVSGEELAKVHSPLGVEIGAATPEEIAVSVLAEMIAVRRGVEPEIVRSMKLELPGRMKVGG